MTPGVVDLHPSDPDGEQPVRVALEGETLVIRDLSVVGVPSAVVAACVEQGRDPEEVVRQILDVGASVLQHGTNTSVVEAVIRELRRDDETRREVKRVSERVAAKGLAYEAQIRPIVEAIFGPHGDVVEDTGGTPGLDGRNKKGDFVVTLNPDTTRGRDRRVVIEAKDRPGQKIAGRDGALAYLAEAMANRDAEAGILVCSGDVPALETSRLRVYSANRVLVRLDKDNPDPLALEVACQLARSLAANAAGSEDAIDTRFMAEKTAALIEILEEASEIRGGVLEARRGIGRIDDAYERLREDAFAVLTELEDRLAD